MWVSQVRLRAESGFKAGYPELQTVVPITANSTLLSSKHKAISPRNYLVSLRTHKLERRLTRAHSVRSLQQRADVSWPRRLLAQFCREAANRILRSFAPVVCTLHDGKHRLCVRGLQAHDQRVRQLVARDEFACRAGAAQRN